VSGTSNVNSLEEGGGTERIGKRKIRGGSKSERSQGCATLLRSGGGGNNRRKRAGRDVPGKLTRGSRLGHKKMPTSLDEEESIQQRQDLRASPKEKPHGGKKGENQRTIGQKKKKKNRRCSSRQVMSRSRNEAK